MEGAADAKPARKQGVSCDACKFRKVRCDRRTKIENKASHEDASQIACSVCSQHGLRCTFTQSAPRRRRGKRIVAIQKSQLGDLDDDLCQRSLEAEQARQQDDDVNSGPLATTAQPSTGAEPLFGFDQEIRDGNVIFSKTGQLADRIRAQASSSKPVSPAAGPQGLFGVRGLTRALLDACIRVYFKYASPCQPILHVEVFSARYALFFALYEGGNGTIPTASQFPDELDETPASLILILAVGCVGAALLEPPIAEPGSLAKFRLQDRMALRFQEILDEKDMVTRLKEEGADVLEACYIMSDPSLKVLGNDQKDKDIDWDRVLRTPVASRALLDPLKMSPSTAEAVVRMLFSLGLNKRPKPRKDCPPGDKRSWISGGIFITEREVFRRVRIFWSAFMQDSFRSMGTRKNVLIGDDDYDLDLPRIIPRSDGYYTALLFSGMDYTNDKGGALDDYSPFNPRRTNDDVGPDPQPASVFLQPARFARFDALQLEVMLRLAFIIRTVSIRFVSPRAQGRGVLITDVERSTSSLAAWWAQLPKDVTWEVQVKPLLHSMREGKVGSNNAVALRNSIKAIFVELLYHGNVLAVWASVADYDIRFEVDLTEAVHLFAARLGLEETAGLQVKDSVSKTLGQEGETEERKRKAQAGMDQLASRSFTRVAKVAKEAGLVGIMRANRSVVLNVCSSYAVWGCDLGRRMAQTGTSYGIEAPPGLAPVEYTFSCVEDILFAMSTHDSFEAAPDIVRQISELLQKSRESVQDLGDARSQHYNDGGGGKGLHDTSDNLARGSKTWLQSTPSPNNAVSGNSEDTSRSSSEMPFHYFYRKGNKLHLGDSLREVGRRSNEASSISSGSSTFPSPSNSSAMDVDEVSLLARAALPKYDRSSRQGPELSSGVPSTSSTLLSRFSATDPRWTAGMEYKQTHDPALNLNLQSITGTDTSWLLDYLQSDNSQVADKVQGSATHSAVPYKRQTSVSEPELNAAASTERGHPKNFDFPALDFTIGNGQMSQVPMTADQVAMQASGLDVQWDQLMASAGDAQIWAESQWQGFHFVPPESSS